MEFIDRRNDPADPFLSGVDPGSAVSIQVDPFYAAKIIMRIDIIIDSVPEGLVIFAFAV